MTSSSSTSFFRQTGLSSRGPRFVRQSRSVPTGKSPISAMCKRASMPWIPLPVPCFGRPEDRSRPASLCDDHRRSQALRRKIVLYRFLLQKNLEQRTRSTNAALSAEVWWRWIPNRARFSGRPTRYRIKPLLPSDQSKARFGPAGAAVWSSPTIGAEKGVLYVGTGDNYSETSTATSDAIFALSLDGGRALWIKQLTANDTLQYCLRDSGQIELSQECGPDFAIGAPPILRNLAGKQRILIVAQKSGVVYLTPCCSM